MSAKHETDSSLIEAYTYINNVPGKDVRGKLIDCFQHWLNVPEASILHEIKQIVAELHNASLLIDDIEDNSKMRRGIPVAHSIFGTPNVINCANYIYFLALERCHRLNNQDAMNVFVTEMLNLHRGQGYDIMWRDNVSCPTEQQYLDMVQDKTGGLFRLAVGLMQAFATTRREVSYTTLLNKLSLYFQIRDDLINLSDPEYMKNKSFCEDLSEGKFSFPIIHCIRKNLKDTRLVSILKQRTEDVDVKKYAQNLMRESGSLIYARDTCVQLHSEIVELVQELGNNEALLNVLELLHKQINMLKDVIS